MATRSPKHLAAELARLAGADPFIISLARLARSDGPRLLLVGGLVRDLRLGMPPRDADFILIGRGSRGFLREVAARTGRTIVTFRKRGVVDHRISIGGRDHDLVEVRRGSLARELRRRDFTINSVAFDLTTRRILDPCGGLGDLSARRIRANSPRVFRDDPLRMIRAVRLRSELPGFSIDRRTSALVRRDACLVARTSPERIRDELDRILLSPLPSAGVRMLDRLGLLPLLVPEIEPLRHLVQNRYHHLDAWRHTLAALAAADDLRELSRGLAFGPLPSGERLLLLRWSLLFHDLGKAGTRTLGEDGEFHFFGHEKRSAALASRIMKRLVFSTRRARAIRRLVELHLRVGVPAEGELSERACRRLIREAGELTPLLALHSLADKEGSRGAGWRRTMARLRRTCRKILWIYRSSGSQILSPPRLVDGHDVMLALRIGPGKEVGRILAEVRSHQAAGEVATREQAIELVRALGSSAPAGERDEQPGS